MLSQIALLSLNHLGNLQWETIKDTLRLTWPAIDERELAYKSFSEKNMMNVSGNTIMHCSCKNLTLFGLLWIYMQDNLKSVIIRMSSFVDCLINECSLYFPGCKYLD